MTNKIGVSRLDVKAIEKKFVRSMPKIRRVAYKFFAKHYRRDDMIDEVIGICWKETLRYAERGISFDHWGKLAKYICHNVAKGSTLADGWHAADALNHLAEGENTEMDLNDSEGKHVKGYRYDDEDNASCRKIPDDNVKACWEDWFDNDMGDPADVVPFKIDFETFLSTLSHNLNRTARLLAIGNTAPIVAKQIGLSAQQINFRRRVIAELWEEING